MQALRHLHSFPSPLMNVLTFEDISLGTWIAWIWSISLAPESLRLKMKKVQFLHSSSIQLRQEGGSSESSFRSKLVLPFTISSHQSSSNVPYLSVNGVLSPCRVKIEEHHYTSYDLPFWSALASIIFFFSQYHFAQSYAPINTIDFRTLSREEVP